MATEQPTPPAPVLAHVPVPAPSHVHALAPAPASASAPAAHVPAPVLAPSPAAVHRPMWRRRPSRRLFDVTVDQPTDRSEIQASQIERQRSRPARALESTR